jgi:hypothetical protein
MLSQVVFPPAAHVGHVLDDDANALLLARRDL